MIAQTSPRRRQPRWPATARYDVEYRVMRPDGDARVVHSQGDVIRDASGRPLRQFGVLQDITERRQAEDELSEVKEHYRVLAESSLTGTYVATEDALVYANPAMARMFGYAVEEIVGGLRSVDLTCPEDRPLVAENMRRRLSGEVEELRYEFRGLRKDGSVFPVEVYGRRIEHAGKSAVLGTIVDNTERRRAEDELRASETRFRTLVDHAADAFFLIDDTLRVVDVNRRACESLGYSRDELVGMHPRDFDAALDDPSIARLADRARARRNDHLRDGSPAQGWQHVPGGDSLAHVRAGRQGLPPRSRARYHRPQARGGIVYGRAKRTSPRRNG